MAINRKAFFTALYPIFGGHLNQSQVGGVEKILDEWERRGQADLRWLAYMFATVKLETAATMLPIHEKGGNAYFAKYDPPSKIAKTLGNTKPGDGPRFHGRGYVQLTGRSNYARATKELGVDFIANPDAALDPANAAQIMFAGMVGGWFTGHRLAQYFNADLTDWYNARRIINGTDKADEIAADAKRIYAGLMAASEPEAAVASLNAAPAPLPPPPTPAKSPTNWTAIIGGGIPAAAAVVKGAADAVNQTVIQVNDSAGAVKNSVTVIKNSTDTIAGYVNWHVPPGAIAILGIVGLIAIAIVVYRHSRLLKDAAQ